MTTKLTPNMYKDAKTWNPFKGCGFDCTYCEYTFKAQSKRQKHLCSDCYDYTHHYHEERLKGIPAASIVFVAGNADLAFCDPVFLRKIIDRIKEHSERVAGQKTFYLQSKKPACFRPFLKDLPNNVILVTTLETNRDEGYSTVSKAPKPSVRHRQFKGLDYPRKVVTVEPVMDFDLVPFARLIKDLKPEYVWLGFDSHPKLVTYPEPTVEKVEKLAARLKRAGIEVRGKTLRGASI